MVSENHDYQPNCYPIDNFSSALSALPLIPEL